MDILYEVTPAGWIEELYNKYESQVNCSYSQAILSGKFYGVKDRAIIRLAENQICELIVKEEYQGKGYGKQLLSIVPSGFYVAVKRDNKIAFNMYRKYGFLEFGDLIDNMIALRKI